ncbi:MAG: spermidine synthase, partial [Candidatus Limnocylindria bacterium]|nr:spermidine synthase [Candidatus Limnocylindria bacterium]
LRLGVTRHPDRPYDDPRVSRHVNDGRAFLRASDQRYDLVIFAQTDSLTLVAATANLRLESFLFTEEAFASVRDHLADDGIFVLYNQYRETWLVERIVRELERTFGSPPLLSSDSLGGNVNYAVFAAGPGIAALRGADPPGDRGGYRVVTVAPRPATDDWPFTYLLEPAIPGRYLLALAAVLVFGALVVGAAARAGGRRLAAFSPHFFVLGVAFLLLETRSLVTFSLLFGTTWIVNALTFFAILASVLAAIGLNAAWRVRDARWLYGALAVALALGYALPPSSLLVDPPWLRYAIASSIAFAPIFLANLVFTHSFRDSDAADMAFASNLLGAMVGGALEWVALVSGYQALLLVVGACYLVAYALTARWRVLGDHREVS